MAQKCKKGYKKVGNKCKTKILYLGITEGDKKTIKNLLGNAVFTISAWGVFWAIINLTGLRDSNPWILLTISLIIGIITFRLGKSR